MTTNSPLAFTYPDEREHRRHGPAGYSDYESYRPWLRDEFDFRCVYCLLRERWGRFTGEFDLDHFVPQSRDESQSLEYENLVYSCHGCNLRKGSASVPNPEKHLTSETVVVKANGRLVGLTPESEALIDALSLNSPSSIQWRVAWMRIIQLASEQDPDLFQSLMGYPDELPDLSALNPPSNSRPDGIDESYLARSAKGALDATFTA